MVEAIFGLLIRQIPRLEQASLILSTKMYQGEGEE